MPRRMIFWQKRNTTRVGMEMTTKPAVTIHGASAPHIWLAWYIHTESVHMLCFWQMISAHSQPL